MQKEKKIWSEHVVFILFEEDNALKTLREIRKISKWSEIAKKMEEEFGIKGKNGKRCRERYFNNLSPSLKKDIWTEEEEKELIRLHNEKGNKWAEIAKILGRSDNGVKNHYHSKLRKGIRRINNRISIFFKNEHRLLKYNIISKIVQTAENVYLAENEQEKHIAESCYEMKNQILASSEDKEHFTSHELENLKKLVIQINLFNRTHKRKSKSCIKSSNSKFVDVDGSESDSVNLSSAEEVQENSEVSKQNNKEEFAWKLERINNEKDFLTNKKMEEELLEKEKNIEVKKYELRDRSKNSTYNKKVNDSVDKNYLIKSSCEIIDAKESCKTPSDIDNFCMMENGNKSFGNYNQQFSPFSWSSVPLFCLMYQNLGNSYNLCEKNESEEFNRKTTLDPFNFITLSENNLFWNPIISQQTQKDNIEDSNDKKITSMSSFGSEKRLCSQGFVRYKKEE